MRTVGPGAVLTALLLGVAGGGSSAPPTVSALISGGEREYTVVAGDTIWGITGRFTMGRDLFDTLNALEDPDRLRPGMRLRVSDRHIVPRQLHDGIVVDLAGRTLYWFEGNSLKARFPVGVGRTDWATPPGRYRIVGRRQDPVWRVPPSIQAEMRARGERPVAVVEAGPDNPLGKYWIQLSAPGYGIHGTNAPGSVGKYATHGCLRLLNADVEQLYREARDGTPVEVVWEPIKLARDGDGRIALEIHRDVYRGRHADEVAVRAAIAAAGLEGTVDWARVADVVARAWGAPEDVTATAPAAAGVVSTAQE